MQFLRAEHEWALEDRIQSGPTIQFLEQCKINKQ